jgi:hypothetical protein
MPPPKAPKVTCSGGNLTISADNSTLGAILTAVHTCTGVQIDIPDAASSRRTFEELGPGPERQILESLLSGTDLNFVIGSSDDNPQKIASVMLMARTTEATGGSANDTSLAGLSPARRAWKQSVQTNKLHSPTPIEETHTETDEAADAPVKEESAATPAVNTAMNTNPVPVSDAPPSPTPAPEAPQAPAETVVTPAQNLAAETSAPVNPALNSDKSTAEKITDMQQMFAQRRQLNQNQNSATPQ